jgi:hypothetical protein
VGRWERGQGEWVRGETGGVGRKRLDGRSARGGTGRAIGCIRTQRGDGRPCSQCQKLFSLYFYDRVSKF